MTGLKGKHNWQNACAAYCVGKALDLTVEKITAGMDSFGGLVHRMEEVGRIGETIFVNDSKGTNADATAHALETFAPIYWIAGGRSKQGGIEPLALFFDNILRAYLIGEAANDFASTLEGSVPFEMCETLENAVQLAAVDAEKENFKDAVVLLSPACSSFDQFQNFEQRGDKFRDLVSELEGIKLRSEVAARC